MTSPEKFAGLIKDLSYKGKPKSYLNNVTFFLGAGFSKSWDVRFPVGDQLFNFDYGYWSKNTSELEGFFQMNGLNPYGMKITSGLFKNTVYQLGMLKKYQSIRPRYIDDQNIALLERELRSLVMKKFIDTAPTYYLDTVLQKLRFDDKLTDEQEKILKLFQRIDKESDGSSGSAEGLRPQFLTTNYDFLLEAILDNSLGVDDTFHLYTYRGVTPRKIVGMNDLSKIHDHWISNNLLKINGGFELYEVDGEYEFDYTKKSFAEIRAHPPRIMLPSREQDYQQRYFSAIFPKSIRLLQESTALIIVGYSLPQEDALLRFLIRQFAEDVSDADKKVVYYIDMADDKEQTRRIESVFPDLLNGNLKVESYSGSFAKWASEVLDCLS